MDGQDEQISLTGHEAKSQWRYEELMKHVDKAADKVADAITDISKEDKMGMDNVSDKVNINVGEGGGRGGADVAAVIAALGNRNQGNDNAALIAALGNRNDSAANLGPLLAMMGNRRDDHDGMNNLWPIILLALLGRGGRGGLFGSGGDDCGGGGGGAETRIEDQAATLAILNKLGTIEAAIPLASAQTENVILQQTNQITNLASQAQLANAAGFSAVGDKVERVGAANLVAISNVNQNVLEQGCQTRAAVAASTTAILQKLDQNTIDDLRHRAERAERQVEVNALRSQVEVNQTVTTTQSQAQAQQQQQLQFQDVLNELRACRRDVAFVHQEARATNSNVIAGNTGAVVTGPQAANPTNVNA